MNKTTDRVTVNRVRVIRGNAKYLMDAGLPVTPANSRQMTTSGLIGWANLISWFVLMFRSEGSGPKVYAELPLLYVIPGLVYWLTKQRWPAFALACKVFLLVQAGALPILLIFVYSVSSQK